MALFLLILSQIIFLSGITRKNILRIADDDPELKSGRRPVAENRIRLAKEAFITNTSAEVTPVIEIGGNTVGDGVPGSITRIIRDKFDDEINTFKG
jgi:D-alanine transaminase